MSDYRDFEEERIGLDEYGWTNQGTRKWCWEAEDGEDVP